MDQVENVPSAQAPVQELTDATSLHPAVKVVCPACAGELRVANNSISCENCAREYPIVNGIPDLIIGERFDDGQNEECLCYEEEANADTVSHYWIPLFKRLWRDTEQPPRILSVGCGTGVDVDMLHAAGFAAIGIDCGNRTNVWHRREHTESLLLANGKKLPFETGTFDAVFCGCVFPHVGVVGDSFTVSESYFEDRLGLAQEMTRVLKPGGKIVVSSPNGNCPFDLFHGRDSGAFKPRVNPPGSKFLLSVKDYGRLFQQAGCSDFRPLPVEGYWGFVRSRHSLAGRILAAPVRFAFWLVSRPAMALLRGTAISPWIVVMAEKPAVKTAR